MCGRVVSFLKSGADIFTILILVVAALYVRPLGPSNPGVRGSVSRMVPKHAHQNQKVRVGQLHHLCTTEQVSHF